MKNNKVSVCMATYNGSRYIKSQIESILCQLKPYDELIISDDGSKDETISIIEDFKDERIKVVHHVKNRKAPKICTNTFLATFNFENSLKYATGDYIFFCDQDDLWMPDKVAKTINLLSEKPESVVISILNVIDKDNKVIQENPTRNIPTFWEGLTKCGYTGCTMAFDKLFLEKAFPFPKYIVSHDIWMGLLATYKHQLIVLNEPVIHYRRHGDNVTANVRNPLWFKIVYRLYYLYAILKREHL